MSDQDFNFGPPPPRREAKTFEPPPWERDQFDELARRKAAEKAAAAHAGTETAEEPAGESPSEAPPDEMVGVATPVVSTHEPARDAGNGAPFGESARVEAMMIELRHEDPPFGTELWKVSIASAAVLGAVGAVLMVWGVFAVANAGKTGVTGSLGGMVILAFGLGFVGVSGWIAFRTLRQRGVL